MRDLQARIEVLGSHAQRHRTEQRRELQREHQKEDQKGHQTEDQAGHAVGEAKGEVKIEVEAEVEGGDDDDVTKHEVALLVDDASAAFFQLSGGPGKNCTGRPGLASSTDDLEAVRGGLFASCGKCAGAVQYHPAHGMGSFVFDAVSFVGHTCWGGHVGPPARGQFSLV